MVFVTAVRDYIDFLNDSFAALGQGVSTPQIVQQTALYLVESCKLALLYLVTFQWLRDFAYLPILIPKFTLLIYKESLVLAENPGRYFFTFGGIPTIVQNKFFVGFFNSIFACLPFSCAHLVALRRFYLQGWPVALTTSLGIIAGNIFFLTSVLFGWRALIFPWLHFEPWNYIIGLFLITNIVYNFGLPAGVAQHRSLTAKDLKVYLSTGLTAFILTLCEQGVIFQHLTTFTVGLEPSFLEPLTGTSQNLVLAHSLYILGFLLGSLVFTFLSYGAAMGFRFIVTQICLITEVRFNTYYQRYSKYLIMGIAVTTVPFYGLDYFVINPLGFVPNDTALTRGSLFAPNTELDTWYKEHQGQYSKDLPDLTTTYPYMADYPLAGFDRGIYFNHKVGIIVNPDSGTGQEFLTDEDYMLPVENAWRSHWKREQTPRRDLMRKHRASLQRIKIWLRKIAPKLSESEKKRLEQDQQKSAGSANTGGPRARRKKWVPEQFNQFTILDNVNSTRDPNIFPRQEVVEGEIFRASALAEGEANKGPEPFRTNSFEKIDKVFDLVAEAALDAEKNSISEVPRQNFEEFRRSFLSFEYSDPDDIRNFYFLRLWEVMNTFLPEEIQYSTLASNNLKVPFQRKKHRQFNRSFRNNVYSKALMRIDIDAFLNRQPKHHTLTPAEEEELYFKRTMLSDYYNSMRRYQNMNNGKQFLLAYGGTKSLAHKVYNHQFKGTYRVARRLLSVDLGQENQRGKTRKRVLKYDQPLYDETKSHNPMVHEELQKYREEVQDYLSSVVKLSDSYYSEKARSSLRARYLQFFIPSNTHPFYCGWDASRRQFVLTNRYAARRTAGMIGLNLEEKRMSRLLIFKSWPIMNPYYNNPYYNTYNMDSKGYISVNREAERWNDKNLRGAFPTNRRNRLDLKKKMNKYFAMKVDPINSPSYRAGFRIEWPAGLDLREWMQPLDWWQNEHPPIPFADRGGFVWPGHEKLKTQYLSKEMKEVLNKQPQELLIDLAKTLRNKVRSLRE
jgi:hypothetical protein